MSVGNLMEQVSFHLGIEWEVHWIEFKVDLSIALNKITNATAEESLIKVQIRPPFKTSLP